ncbi:MAG: iron-sulfur cluster assembly accessory protein [Vampirovibrio sp.]|nr:iron-sulfur cluster assembly accessory protein [Vampirovibrio sp.]
MSETTTQTAPQDIVSVTEEAAKKVQEILSQSNDAGVRLGVIGGGCAGLQYDMKPEAAPTEGDIIQEAHGVKFFVHPMVVPYLKDTTLDFSNDMLDGGFKFINPNATSSCGCGSSFGV